MKQDKKDFYMKYFDEKQEIKSFKEQLLEFEYGIKDYYFPFLVNESSKKLEYAQIKSKWKNKIKNNELER